MSHVKIYEPNYTQVPNAVISLMPSLTGAELKVIMAIVRKTAGWKKSKDRISYSQLQEMTGLGREAVSSAVQSPEWRGIIKVHKTARGNEYELIDHENPEETGSKIEPVASSKIEPPGAGAVRKSNQTSSKIEPIAGSKIEHTKETTTKETNKRKARSRAGESESDSPAAVKTPSSGKRLTTSEIYETAAMIDATAPSELPALLKDLFRRAADHESVLQLWMAYLKSTGKPVNNWLLGTLMAEHKSTPLPALKKTVFHSISKGYKSLIDPATNHSADSESSTRRAPQEFSAHRLRAAAREAKMRRRNAHASN